MPLFHFAPYRKPKQTVLSWHLPAPSMGESLKSQCCPDIAVAVTNSIVQPLVSQVCSMLYACTVTHRGECNQFHSTATFSQVCSMLYACTVTHSFAACIHCQRIRDLWGYQLALPISRTFKTLGLWQCAFKWKEKCYRKCMIWYIC